MDIEFHYYMTAFIAKAAGFSPDKAHILAYASQFVDDNNDDDYLATSINAGSSKEYKRYISQTMDLTKPRSEHLKIYPYYHFVPGDPNAVTAKRKDGKTHRLNCTPNNQNANAIIDAALKSGDLYWIGIATHMYVDTWAHQNFIGIDDEFNAMNASPSQEKNSAVRFFKRTVLNIGHAKAGHKPDIPGLIWIDDRLEKDIEEIHNTRRFIEAAEHLFKKFAKHNSSGISDKDLDQKWIDLKTDLLRLIGEEFRERGSNLHKYEEARNKRYKEYDRSLPEYDPYLWVDDAVMLKINGLPDVLRHVTFWWNWLYRFFVFATYVVNNRIFGTKFEKDIADEYFSKDGFDKSHWYNFQEALRKHQTSAKKVLAPIMSQFDHS